MKTKNLPLIGVSPETDKLRYRLSNAAYSLFELGGGCLAWRFMEPERTVLLYDPSNVFVEFFIGGGSTITVNDTERASRIVIDSAFSKAQMKRAHSSPYFSGRYAFEWHGKTEPMEVPFPMYMDQTCVVATIRPDGYV